MYPGGIVLAPAAMRKGTRPADTAPRMAPAHTHDVDPLPNTPDSTDPTMPPKTNPPQPPTMPVEYPAISVPCLSSLLSLVA